LIFILKKMIGPTIKFFPEKNTFTKTSISNPIPEDLEKAVLLNLSCHVDHEGFDLNDIEQVYCKANDILLTNDSTWYKDGGKENGATAVIYPWKIEILDSSLIVDHAHFVFRYAFEGEARKQVLKYAEQRPELYRLLSAKFKCGLDLCIDFINRKTESVEPIVHIEWDFDNIEEMKSKRMYVESILSDSAWSAILPSILRYNSLCRYNKVDAFDQANTRSMVLFGVKSYKLIPTI
jgi:hypothetical protein